jgi:methylthioribulose 1-phosphate dehydratase/enolase-phosphatase E1
MDIEGTTTSISFVHDTLFPYAKSAVGAHVREKLQRKDPEIFSDIAALRAQALVDSKGEGGREVPLIPEEDGTVGGREGVIEAVVRNVEWQMGRDRKTTALKQLQGHIWRAGYEKGEIRSHVYEDVPEALRRWSGEREGGRAGALKLAIYSSGSREAQRLLFGYTAMAGDVRECLNCYFDTTVGGKREEGSYREIGLSLGVDGMEEVLFLTDVVEEGMAARKAGMRVLLSVRPGNAPIDEMLGREFARVSSFAEVDDYLEGRKAFPSL